MGASKRVRSPKDTDGAKDAGGCAARRPRMCAFVRMPGGCRNGGACGFCHSKKELELHPRYKTRPCLSFFSSGECAAGADCGYYHDEAERREAPEDPAPTVHRPVIPQMCHYAESTGGCHKGATCKFCHNAAQLALIYKTRPCDSFWLHGRCDRGEDCGFYHSEDERRQGPAAGEAAYAEAAASTDMPPPAAVGDAPAPRASAAAAEAAAAAAAAALNFSGLAVKTSVPGRLRALDDASWTPIQCRSPSPNSTLLMEASDSEEDDEEGEAMAELPAPTPRALPMQKDAPTPRTFVSQVAAAPAGTASPSGAFSLFTSRRNPLERQGSFAAYELFTPSKYIQAQ